MEILDMNKIRKDFPALENQIYLDNASTTQKPLSVMEGVLDYNKTIHSNPHRGAYKSSVLATEAYERTRKMVQNFIGAKEVEEIIFTRGTTEAINLVARSLGEDLIQPGDEIVLTIAEHHSNLLPWQWVAKTRGAQLKYLYVDQYGRLDMEKVKETITEKTKLVTLTHVSNVLGNIYPVREISNMAHEKGAWVLVDGAQSVPHLAVDVIKLGVDFFAFSGHKIYGPTGIGVLYGRREILEKMPPFLYGGSMIEYVTQEDATFASIPNKFEAGTQNIEGVIGLERAISYVQNIGMEKIAQYEQKLTIHALRLLKEVEEVTVIGSNEGKERSGVISFVVEGVHPHDVATIMDSEGICIRSGHHCAQPLMSHLGVHSTGRVSFSFYNTFQEVEFFVEKLKTVRKWLGYGS
jgi:cysteine desulfurase / selenocysteine lyase